MTAIYEGMFLLDNELVRADWSSAKARVTGLLEKHGAEVRTARRWAERKLAYPIERRLRATYLLVYYTLPVERIPGFQRELDLTDGILRYLVLRVDEVPSSEAELAAAEQAADFVMPAPPADEIGSYSPLQGEGAQGESERSDSDSDDSGDEDDDRRGRRRERVGVTADGSDDDKEDE